MHDSAPVFRNRPRHVHAWPGTRVPAALRAVQRAISARRFVVEHNARLPADARVLHFLPMRPDPLARVSDIVARLGMRIGGTPRNGEPAIAWETGTWLRQQAAIRLPENAINRRCVDISKSTVDRLWAGIAGYSITIDPCETSGPFVVKSERNGTHDGLVVIGPLRARRVGYVYERFVDTRDDGSLVELRTTVIGGRIVVVIVRRRPEERWFAEATSSVERPVSETYSASEVAQLLAFCGQIGLDYGELDVLRDRHSGRIYVVDANRTPYGPGRAPNIATANVARVSGLMTDAFRELIEQRWP